MKEILLIIEISCFAPLVINSTPYKKILDYLDWNDSELLTCCLCSSTYIGLIFASIGMMPFIAVPLVAVISELIDAKINDF